MNIGQAKTIARGWVIDQAIRDSGFRGAFFHGSSAWLADEVELPATSDLDVMIVLGNGERSFQTGKFVHRGVLLEISVLTELDVATPEMVLGNSHLAGSFRMPGVILDPTGQLTRIQETVEKEFARRDWVVRRCEHVRGKILHAFPLNEADPLHDQIVSWLFPAGITTHLLLVAGLRDPTVRKRYVDIRKVLEDYDRLDFYQKLLDLLGCGETDCERVENHLTMLGKVFDLTKSVIRSPVPYAADISEAGRPVAIDGSRELIESGHHREAIFWMLATWTRCCNILAIDGSPEQQARFEPNFRELLSDLGIGSIDDVKRRKRQVEDALPEVWAVAQEIIANNPGIVGNDSTSEI